METFKDSSLSRIYSREILNKLKQNVSLLEKPAFENEKRLMESLPEIFPHVRNHPELIQLGIVKPQPQSLIESLRNFEELPIKIQISKFLEFVMLSKEEKLHMKDLIEALEKALQRQFPDCKAWPYGSSACGLSLKGSDLDIYVDLWKCFMVKGSIRDNQARTQNVYEVLMLTERFRKSTPILGARIPIIKVKDRVTDIKCDINVVNAMGVKNTEFLALCCDLDDRVQPVICLVKYFCSIHKVISSGMGSHLNSYTLVLMTIFFFQVKGILPTVADLQVGVDKEMIGGWNFAFARTYDRESGKVVIKEPAILLLKQLFKFYRDFSFDHYVICPLVGHSIRRSSFHHGGNLPKVMKKASTLNEKLIVDSSLVVQDPFELTRNVGHAVSRVSLDHMIASFSIASRLVKDIARADRKDVQLWMLFEPGLKSYRDILNESFLSNWDSQTAGTFGLKDMWHTIYEDELIDEDKDCVKEDSKCYFSDSEVIFDDACVDFLESCT